MRSCREVPTPLRTAALLTLAALTLTACREAITEPASTHITAYSSHGTGPVVNSTDDPGDGTCDEAHCTLREAIAAAEAGDEITFDPALVRSTILLGGTRLVLDRDLTITGPGAGDLVIDGGGVSSILRVDEGVSARVGGLTLTRGFSTNSIVGAVVSNFGALTLEQCVIRDVQSPAEALIFNFSTLALRHCTVADNMSAEVIESFIAATIDASTLTGNDTGALLFTTGDLTIRNSTISGNTVATILNGVSAKLQNSTVVANQTRFATIGLGDLSLSTSIVAGNSSALGNGECAVATVASSGDNLVGPSDCELEPEDQLLPFVDVFTRVLAPLADNGGPTWTHALLDPAETGMDNPALDAGNCAATGVTEDQRGISRPQDVAGVENVHDGCDIGAFELEVPAAPCTFDELVDRIDALEADGVLNAGLAKALRRKVEQYASLMARGKTHEALAVLEDFRQQVRDLEAMGVLSEEQAASLDQCAADVAEA